MSYVRKLGASALVVAAAFAVAFAVLISSSSTQTVEAADVPLAEDAGAATAAPGDTVEIAVNGALAQVSITGSADGVGASFAANDGQSINCSDNASCDQARDSATPPAHVNNQITVDLKIDEDAGEGYILVSVLGIGAATNTDQTTKVINVSKAGLVGSLEIKTTAATDKTISAEAATLSNLTVTVKNAASTPAGLDDQSVVLITTLGTIGCDGSAGTSQTCTGNTGTDGNGDFAAVLAAGGVEGVATVTATLGSRTDSVDVTLFGSAKNLTAEPQQGSVEIGGSVFVVLTVTDAAGNPVSGQVIEPASKDEVVGPEGVDNPVLVVTSRATDEDPADDVGYNVDYIATKSADSLPACGDDKDPATDSGATPPTVEDFDTDGGTNAAGKCVVQVTATEDTADATKSATRGEHTLNFAIGTIKASATIEVAGKPSSISTDAPDLLEPASVTTITVSVFDDEDVLVGITAVKVRKVGGDGLIEDAGDGGSEMTSNGQSKFTFIAPSNPGSSEILITAGTVNHRVTLQIGEAMPEPDPEPEVPSLTLSGSGALVLATFSGGSVDELGAAAEAACGANVVVWSTTDSGFVSYSPSAPAPINAAFAAEYADGAPAAVFLSDCEPGS